MKKETLENKVVRLALSVNKLIDRIEKLENNVNKLAWDKAQHEDLVKLEDRIEKLEKIIDWKVAHTTMRGVPDLPPNAKCIMEEDKEILRSLADSDFHETPKQRWMRENLRPGEVYAGIMLGSYDYHLIVTTGVNSGLVPNSRELDLMRANLVSGKYIRRIPVEYP